ncbi:hypothetical protein ACFL15_00680 [Patescibacteria group bacterium]
MIKLNEKQEGQKNLDNLPKGLGVIPLPEIENVITSKNEAKLTPKTSEEVQKELTSFLNDLNEKGLELKTIVQFPIKKRIKYGTNYGEGRSGIEELQTTQYFAIVKK